MMRSTYRPSPFIAGFRDWLTPAFLGATVVPFFLLLGLALILIVAFFGDLSSWMEGGAWRNGLADWLNSWPSSLHFLSSWLLDWAVLGVSAVLLGIALVILALFTSVIGGLMALSVLTPWIVATIRRRHYPGLDLRTFGNPVTSLAYTLVVGATMGLLIVLALPVYFIPVVGFLVFNLFAYLLFEKLLVRDVASTMLSRDEYDRIRTARRRPLRVIAFVCYCFSLIPVLGLFLQVLFVCILAHFFFGEIMETRGA